VLSGLNAQTGLYKWAKIHEKQRGYMLSFQQFGLSNVDGFRSIS
jgi:3-methyladenine DNA glycosylase Tag